VRQRGEQPKGFGSDLLIPVLSSEFFLTTRYTIAQFYAGADTCLSKLTDFPANLISHNIFLGCLCRSGTFFYAGPL